MPTLRWTLYEYLPSAPSFTHPFIISFIHSSIHMCTLTHTENYGGQGLISECLSQSCLHLVSFICYLYLRMCVCESVHTCDQRTAGRVSSCLLQPCGPCKPSFWTCKRETPICPHRLLRPWPPLSLCHFWPLPSEERKGNHYSWAFFEPGPG